MYNYLHLLEKVTDFGTAKNDRTGFGTLSIHGNMEVFHPCEVFPAVTTKPLTYKSVVGELLNFIKGSSYASDFRELKCKVWDKNANKEGDNFSNAWLKNPMREKEDHLGRIYGVQWRELRDIKIMPNKTEKELFQIEHMVNDLGYKNEGEVANGVVLNRTIDQLKDAVNKLQNDPFSRRIIIDAWNPADLHEMALPPCHVFQHYMCREMSARERISETAHRLFERYFNGLELGIPDIENGFSIAKKNMLSKDEDFIPTNEFFLSEVEGMIEESLGGDCTEEQCHNFIDELGIDVPRVGVDLLMYQRSCDLMLGAPFNIASYATMLQIMARISNLCIGNLIYVTGDTHIYSNHMDAVREQLKRNTKKNVPNLVISDNIRSLEDVEKAKCEDFVLTNYVHHPALENPTPMAN